MKNWNCVKWHPISLNSDRDVKQDKVWWNTNMGIFKFRQATQDSLPLPPSPGRASLMVQLTFYNTPHSVFSKSHDNYSSFLIFALHFVTGYVIFMVYTDSPWPKLWPMCTTKFSQLLYKCNSSGMIAQMQDNHTRRDLANLRTKYLL